jgi:arsenate reductase
MAEGWTNHLKRGVVKCRSAGVEAHGLNPLAVKVMAEAGLDISHHKSQLVGEFLNEPWDFVITVCGQAHEACPLFPGKAKIVHVGFDDPPALAKSEPSEEAAMVHYRRVRDEIRTFVASLPESLWK